MSSVLWKWVWRFSVVVVVLTVGLSLGVGAWLRHAHLPIPPWLGGVLSLVVVIVVAGGMFPAYQSDMNLARERHERPGGHPPGDRGG